ncbi:MAG TPA: WD40 repeat domain-containing protein [Vicinamibacterales bacterium]
MDEPYIGFSAYDEARAEFLGGRDSEILVIVSNVRVSPLTVLYGPTGVGKSSTLCAGVMPALKRVAAADPAMADEAPAVVYFKEWQAAGFERALNDTCLDAVDWGDAGRPALPEDHHLDDIVRAAQQRDASVIFIFDQFEDYLIAGGRAGSEFDRVIARLVNRRDLSANLLISIQEDHLAKLDRLRARIPHLLGNAIRMDPLDEANAAKAIRKPLEAFNQHAPATHRTVMGEGDEDPVPVVIADGRADGLIEPAFLQLVMRQLWREETRLWAGDATKHRMLRRSVLVNRLGGVAAVIDSHLNTTLAATLTHRELPIAARIFRSLVNSHGDKVSLFSEEIARAVEPQVKRNVRRMLDSWSAPAAAADPVWAPALTVLRKLEAARLLRRIPGDRYELFHQVLAPAVLAWRRRFEQQHERRMLIQTASVVALVASTVLAVIVGLVVRQRTLDKRARSTLFAQYARDVPQRDPPLAMTLALYSLSQFPSASARDVLLLAMDRTVGRLPGHAGQVASVAFNGDGSLLASGGSDNAVKFWHPGDERLAASFSPHHYAINAVVFRPGHQQLLTASDDKTAILWDVSDPASPQQVFTLGAATPAHQHADEIWGAAVSPDGKYAVTVSKDRLGKLWDLDTGQWLRDFAGHTDSVVVAAFSPDSRTVATGGLDKEVRLWNVSTGASSTLAGHSDYVYGLSFSPDGRQLASGGWDQTVIVWNLADRSIATHLAATNRVWGVRFSPSGKQLAAATRDGNLNVWDLSTGARDAMSGNTGVLTEIAYSPSGSAIAAGTLDGGIRLFSLPGLKELSGQLTSATVSSNGVLIAGGVESTAALQSTYDIKLWQVLDGKFERVFDPAHRHSGEVVSVAVSEDRQYVFTGSRDRTARLWSADGTFIGEARPEPHAHENVVQGVALDASASRLATASWDGTVGVWERSDTQITFKTQLRPFDGDRVYAVVFAPDSRHLASGGYAEYVRIDDLADEKSVVKLSLPPKRKQTAFAIRYSPDGSSLIAGFDDGSLYVWRHDASGWQTTPVELDGHNTSITYMTFDIDGSRFATSSTDGTSRVWDSKSGQLIMTVPSRGEAIRALVFHGQSPHEQLLTVSVSGRLRDEKIDWDPGDWSDPESLLNVAAQRARPLTPTECRRYFNGSCPDDVPHQR